MSIANKQIHLKYLLIVFGMLFSCTLVGQTKTDAQLYATWKDSSKSETVRLEAIWERKTQCWLPNWQRCRIIIMKK